jgi:hypothetical protein
VGSVTSIPNLSSSPVWIRGAPNADYFGSWFESDPAPAAARGATRLAVADFPRPKETKAFPVPSDDRFRLHDQQGRSPLAPHLPEPYPEDSIGRRQLEPLGRRPAQNTELLPQSQIL